MRPLRPNQFKKSTKRVLIHSQEHHNHQRYNKSKIRTKKENARVIILPPSSVITRTVVGGPNPSGLNTCIETKYCVYVSRSCISWLCGREKAELMRPIRESAKRRELGKNGLAQIVSVIKLLCLVYLQLPYLSVLTENYHTHRHPSSGE